MKTIVTVEDGKVTIQVDDGVVIPILGTVDAANGEVKLKETPLPGGTVLLDKPLKTEAIQDGYNPEKCGFCRKRGEACVRHGGEDSQNYKGKADRRRQGHAPGGNSRSWNNGGLADDRHTLAETAPEAKPEWRSVCCDAKSTIVIDGQKTGSRYKCEACGQACKIVKHLPPFSDLWNCGACREAGRRCRLHAEMEAEGKLPPGSRPLTTNRGGK